MNKELDFKELIITNIELIESEYLKGICLNDIFYKIGIVKRAESMQAKINKLFMLINDEQLEEAKLLLNNLEKVLGVNDGELYQAKIEIELSENFDSDFNDADFEKIEDANKGT